MPDEINWPEDFPEMARLRAVSYLSYGVPPSQAKATAMRDLGYQNKEVADILGVTPDAASSYYSKFNVNFHNETMRLTLAAFGGPKHLLGWSMIHNEDENKEYWYVMKPIQDGAEDLEALNEHPSEGEHTLVKVRADERTFDAESTVYESLDALADDLYRNAELDDLQKAHDIHGMLLDSRILSDTLDDPKWKVQQN